MPRYLYKIGIFLLNNDVRYRFVCEQLRFNYLTLTLSQPLIRSNFTKNYVPYV